jgi:sugar transferase (PEP-CTERM/EpsH1 system associated)
MNASDLRPLITHVVFRFDVGGLENGVVNLINRMPRQDWRHAVVALDRISPSFSQRVERTDVEYVELRKPPGHLVWHYPRLVRLFRRLAPAIAHTRNLGALEATVPAWLAGVPVRVHGEHGWDIDDVAGTRARNRWLRRLYRPFVSKYVALSRHLATYLETSVGVRPEFIANICNGVDTQRFRPAVGGRTPISGSPFTGRDLWLVGTVGRLASVKDQVTLARAFVRARELDSAAHEQMRLVIAGDGPQREAVAQVLREGGAEAQAWLAGERHDIDQLLRGLDAFVLPSLAEGISNTILEAMASGLPIVATAVGGNSELIDSGATGSLVPAANADAMADAMLEDFRDRRRATRRARAAREAAERRFSLDRMVADYCALYRAELARVGRPQLRTNVFDPTPEE